MPAFYFTNSQATIAAKAVFKKFTASFFSNPRRSNAAPKIESAKFPAVPPAMIHQKALPNPSLCNRQLQ